jgi:endonuclease/exonuclease/phosphatase (EEP) superfamily protein YafD
MAVRRGWLLTTILLLVAGTVGAALSCSGARPPRPPTPGRAHVAVMTYNVNYGLAGDGGIVAAIEDVDADLVLLQETTPEWQATLKSSLGEHYEHMVFHHCCGAGGLAILAKHPFVDAGTIEPPAGGWFPAWRIIANTPIGTLQVLNLHLHPPLSESGSVTSGYLTTPPIRKSEVAEFYQHLDPGLPTLIVGDFNEGDGGSAIAYLEERGYRTVVSEFEGRTETWRWNTSVGTVSAQLDHIVYGHGLEPLDARVIQAGRSDHFPVVARFELAPTDA